MKWASWGKEDGQSDLSGAVAHEERHEQDAQADQQGQQPAVSSDCAEGGGRAVPGRKPLLWAPLRDSTLTSPNLPRVSQGGPSTGTSGAGSQVGHPAPQRPSLCLSESQSVLFQWQN